MAIGEQIKDRREALAWSQEELAQAVNGSVQQVSRFLQVKMQRNYTQTAQQPFYVQRHV